MKPLSKLINSVCEVRFLISLNLKLKPCTFMLAETFSFFKGKDQIRYYWLRQLNFLNEVDGTITFV